MYLATRGKPLLRHLGGDSDMFVIFCAFPKGTHWLGFTNRPFSQRSNPIPSSRHHTFWILLWPLRHFMCFIPHPVTMTQGQPRKIMVNVFPNDITTWPGQDSNPRPFGPESGVPTTRPRRVGQRQTWLCCFQPGHHFSIYLNRGRSR